MEFVIFIGSFLLVLCRGQPDQGISLTDMEHVHYQEWGLLRSLRIYIQHMDFNLHELREVIAQAKQRKEMKADIKRAATCPFKNVTSPIISLQAVRGFLSTFDQTRNFVKGCIKLQNRYSKFLKRKRRLLPKMDDMRQASYDVFRVQKENKLGVQAVANGFVVPPGLKSERMRISDMYYLGKAAYGIEKYRLAKDWFDLVLQRLETETYYSFEGSEKELRVSVHEHLGFIEYKLGYTQQALKHEMQVLNLDPKNERALENQKFLNEVLQKKIDVYNDVEHFKESTSEENVDGFVGICSGDPKQKLNLPNSSAMLRCGYKQDDPRLILKPSPFEILSIKPLIFLHHQVIKSSHIGEIIAVATPKLGRHMVGHWIDNHYNSQQRSNTWAWLNSRTAAVAKLNTRLVAITGLSLEKPATVQVTLYGLDEYHLPHYDWLQTYDHSDFNGFRRGDRLATALVYLNEPEKGGDTVFLSPKLKIRPSEGSAVVWYNILRNGKPDYSTQFGSCPVLSGSKWELSKWFYSFGQEFKYPCSLKEQG